MFVQKTAIVSVIHFLFPLKSNQNKFRILVILAKIRPNTKTPLSCLMSLPLDILMTKYIKLKTNFCYCFSISSNVFDQIFSKKAKNNDFIFIEKSKKQN